MCVSCWGMEQSVGHGASCHNATGRVLEMGAHAAWPIPPLWILYPVCGTNRKRGFSSDALWRDTRPLRAGHRRPWRHVPAGAMPRPRPHADAACASTHGAGRARPQACRSGRAAGRHLRATAAAGGRRPAADAGCAARAPAATAAAGRRGARGRVRRARRRPGPAARPRRHDGRRPDDHPLASGRTPVPAGPRDPARAPAPRPRPARAVPLVIGAHGTTSATLGSCFLPGARRMSYTSPLFITFAAYLLLMVAIGFIAWRRTRTFDDYILGGRSLNSYVTALAAGASDMSGWLMMGLPGALYLGGASESWIAIGLVIGAWANWRFVAGPLRVYT